MLNLIIIKKTNQILHSLDRELFGDIMKTDIFVERAYYLIKDEVKLPETLNTGFPAFKKYADSQIFQERVIS